MRGGWRAMNVVLHIAGPFFMWVQLLWGFFGIFQADRPFAGHFWWLGTLSKSHRPVEKPLVLDSKILMALSVCWSRSSLSK